MLVTVSGFILFMISTRSLQTSSTVLSQHETEIDLGYSERPSFSVGFNLGPSSGSVVVNLGNNSIVVERVDGSDAYHEVMAKLSLPSSQHLAPPYDEPGEVYSDWWRVLQRNCRKRLGLPATSDVGTLSSMVSQLRERAETRLSTRISTAALSVPHLIALYQDDVLDTFEYVGLDYIAIDGYFRPLLWETAVGFAGHGLGLCKHYQDVEKCREELKQLPEKTVLSINYAPNALTLSLAVLRTPLSLWEPGLRHYANFTLGSMHEPTRDLQNSQYWRTLREALELFLLEQNRAFLPTCTVIFLGDSAPVNEHEPFAQLVFKVLKQVQSLSIESFFSDAAITAAKGTAELVKRNPFYAAALEMTPNHHSFEL